MSNVEESAGMLIPTIDVQDPLQNAGIVRKKARPPTTTAAPALSLALH
jgi:hypothetical protein